MIYVGGAAGMRNRGAYAAGTTYYPNDMVQWQGSTYLANATTTGNAPNTASWTKLVNGIGAIPVSATVTGTTVGILTTDGTGNPVTTPTANVLVVPALSTYVFELSVSARRLGQTTSVQGFVHTGIITRDATGNGRMIGSVTQLATWSDVTVGTVGFTAASVSGIWYLQIQVTPSSASFTTNWSGTLRYNEQITAS